MESRRVVPIRAKAVPKQGGGAGAYVWVRFIYLMEHPKLCCFNENALKSVMLGYVIHFVLPLVMRMHGMS
jgi:hypothetical protein